MISSSALRSPAKDIFRYSLLIILVAVSFLFSPAPKSEKDFCGQYIHLGAHAGFTFNCDAADYCMAAKTPSRILGDSAIRQSRPLFIYLATAIGHPIQWFTDKLNLPFFKSMGDEASMYIGYYAGYIVINFLTILLSLLLFRSIALSLTGNSLNKWILLAFQLVLISNEVTKAFFWTAHQQFFSLLTPLLTIWLALKIITNKKTLSQITQLSFTCGLLMLLYGNFITLFGTLLIVAFLSDKKFHFTHLIKNIVLFLLPTALWVSYCIYHNGHYYNHEVVRYRQLVWMADAMNISLGTFLHVLGDNILAYLGTFEEMLIFIVMAVLAYISMYRKKADPLKNNKQLQALVITGLISILFFMVLGFYDERLSYTLLPTCLCIIFFSLDRFKRIERNAALYMFVAISWHIYNVLTYGPFS